MTQSLKVEVLKNGYLVTPKPESIGEYTPKESCYVFESFHSMAKWMSENMEVHQPQAADAVRALDLPKALGTVSEGVWTPEHPQKVGSPLCLDCDAAVERKDLCYLGSSPMHLGCFNKRPGVSR